MLLHYRKAGSAALWARTRFRITGIAMTEREIEQLRKLTRLAQPAKAVESAIVRHGSTVLAGIRPAAMFSCCSVHSAEELDGAIEECRTALRPHGVCLNVLARRDKGPLLYLFRPELMQRVLACPAVAENLQALGYNTSSLDSCIGEVSARICEFDQAALPHDFWDFPHEIGYLLGYPPGDVQAFIRNRSMGAQVTGTWCAYGCARRAAAVQYHFDRHHECKDAYWTLYVEGATAADLAALGTLQLP